MRERETTNKSCGKRECDNKRYLEERLKSSTIVCPTYIACNLDTQL